MLYTEILSRKVELWIFSTRFTREKTPQNNFSSQNFSVENNYMHITSEHFIFWISKISQISGVLLLILKLWIYLKKSL